NVFATILETAPTVAAAPAASAPAKAATKKPKKAAGGSKARKPSGPSITELITKAMSASKERKGLSLAVLKKALAAGGYDVEKNNSRIKLGLKSLVSKGTLVQTKGTGASSSFKLNKKPGEMKEKAPKKRTAATKPKKLAAKKPASAAKKPKKAVAVKKSPKKAKKPAATAAKKSSKSPKKAAKAGRPKKAAKSLAKAKAVKPKPAKPKATKPKVAKMTQKEVNDTGRGKETSLTDTCNGSFKSHPHCQNKREKAEKPFKTQTDTRLFPAVLMCDF
ncbi:histone H1.01-like, partial [Apteryx mantelli]|uniref:Histone H1.01-like n=1 Tax=Apteryx mantelli TaxID=2696672 RepID=A0A8B7IWB7_9AVES